MAMVKMARTITKCFEACGKKYKIMQDENGNFWGIDFEVLKKGQAVNGLTGHLSRTLNETLRRCYTAARVAELMKGKSADNETELLQATLTASGEALKMFG